MLEATEITLDRLELWLSEPRLNMYLRAAGDDPWRAYELYLWNANLAQVLLRDISFFEVALRNSHDRCMTKRWNGEAHWLPDPLSPVRSPILRKSKEVPYLTQTHTIEGLSTLLPMVQEEQRTRIALCHG